MQDVIVENRRTGERKRMTVTMANNLDLKYRILPNETNTEKSSNFKPKEEPKTDLERLRLKYFELFKQQPHHRLGEAKLKALIEEELNKDAAKADGSKS